MVVSVRPADPASMWFQAARSRLAWLPVTSGTRRSRLPATTVSVGTPILGFASRLPLLSGVGGRTCVLERSGVSGGEPRL